MGEMTNFINSMGAKRSTAIIQYPSGRFGLAGSVPCALSVPVKKALTPGLRQSMVWENENDAIRALLDIGITEFQLSDCSWYQK